MTVSYLKRLLIIPVIGLGGVCLANDHLPIFPKEDFLTVDPLLKEGDELFSANLNERAIAVYQKVLGLAADLQTIMLTKFHLALTYISQNAHTQAIPLLQENVAIPPKELSEALETIRRNSLYLLALAFQHIHDYTASKTALTTYLSLSTPPALTFEDEARFELGLAAFHEHDDKHAEILFTTVTSLNDKSRLKALAFLYLARIYLAKNNPERAMAALDEATKNYDRSDQLSYEWSYLRGETAFQQHDYLQAITFFEQSIPTFHPERSEWYADSLYYIGWSYLQGSDGIKQNREELAKKLKNSENAFRKMLTIAPQEKAGLALAQCLLIKAGALQDKQAYAQAEEILSTAGLFKSGEGKAHVLLLRAEAAPTYEMREQFYQQLTKEENAGSSFYAKGWYMRGLNAFEHGLALEQSSDKSEAKNVFESASIAFKKAFDLLHNADNAQAGAAIKYRALSISYSGQPDADLKAFQLIDSLMHDMPAIWGSMPHPDEIQYLHGFFAGRLAEQGDENTYLPIASQSLKAAAASPAHKFGDIALRQLGSLYYQQGNNADAEAAYLQLANTFPESPFTAEAWYWSACCADRQQQGPSSLGKERRRHVFETYPHSPYAAQAYFTYYNYQEYLQGDRIAIKHLENFIENYPSSPFLIEAYYLIGLDYKRDRKTPEGKWIRKKSQTDAIDAFQHVETIFDDLKELEEIPKEKTDTYVAMRYRATLERAMANLAIAGEAQGAKKQIYLDYAEEVFKKLIADLSDPNNPDTKRFYDTNPLPSLVVESSFGLAQTHLNAGNNGKAEPILVELIERYRKCGSDHAYYLACTWDKLGNISLQRNDYSEALQRFKNAEDASKGNLLSTDQKLNMWIQQSYCFRGLKQYDDAILILSKVVNDDAVSSLRMKAMYLRAETYEQQGRLELARKQLESMVKKGGLWARKAKEKLEKDYGY